VTAQVIRFPVERRQQQIAAAAAPENTTVVGTALTSADVQGSFIVQFGNGVTTTVTPDSPPWWARVPEVRRQRYEDDALERRMWMKLGVAPAVRGKRHRVVEIEMEDMGDMRVIVATAACGRRAPLSHLFDDAWTGGNCIACRRKGYG
jgi:hypothetical protein